MSGVARIGQPADLLEVEREAMRLLALTQAQPSVQNIMRCADVWRVYLAMFREEFPGKPTPGRAA